MELVGQLEERIKREQREARRKKREEAESRGESVHFDAATGALTFAGDVIVDVSTASGVTDPIVGSLVAMPTFIFDFINPEGDFVFEATGTSPTMELREGDDVFIRGIIPPIVFSNGLFETAVLDPVLAGAPAGSPFDGGLPPLGSAFVDSALTSLEDVPFSSFIMINFVPELDFLAQTDSFNRSESSAVTNSLIVADLRIPEPAPAVMLLSAVGVLMLSRRRAGGRS